MLCFHSLSILACRKNHGCKHTILLLQRKKQRLHEHLDHTLKITSLSCWDSARKLKNFSSDMWYHFTKLVHLISNQCSGWFCDFLPFFSCIPYFSSPSNFFFFFLLNKAGPEVVENLAWWGKVRCSNWPLFSPHSTMDQSWACQAKGTPYAAEMGKWSKSVTYFQFVQTISGK